MSRWTYIYAKSLMRRGQVKIDKVTEDAVFFTCKGYEGWFDYKRRKICCSCISGSMWRVGEECSHARACLMLLEENRKNARRKKQKSAN